jgi:hypothetical protein
MVVSAPDKTSEEVNQEQDSAPKRRNWVALILVCLALQVAALLVTEGVLYVAGLGEEEIFAFDKDLGTKHMTNKRVTWRSEGFGYSYFDANGMQDENLTVAKPANTYRVAVLGDSFVEGIQVHGKNRFTRLLNKAVKLADGKQIQVVNFGTSGYSTAQEYVLLKKMVYQYSPDMVLLCYNSRDIFENWSPADATLTNVRPVALCLPGQPLVVNNSSILEWMKSPRAKFLMSITWIRQNSRIWGLISAAETEMSFNNKTYKTIMDLLTRPKKTIVRLWGEWSQPGFWDIQKLLPASSSGPSFHIQFFEGKDPNAQVNKKASAQKKKRQMQELGVGQIASPAKQPKAASAAPAAKAAPPTEGERNYINLMSRTLDALVTDMDAQCKERKIKFAVVSMPARIEVYPYAGVEKTMYGLDYPGEIEIVRKSCENRNIPFLDVLKPAVQQPEAKRKAMYYALHLAPPGHKFIADQLTPFLEKECVEESGR